MTDKELEKLWTEYSYYLALTEKWQNGDITKEENNARLEIAENIEHNYSNLLTEIQELREAIENIVTLVEPQDETVNNLYPPIISHDDEGPTEDWASRRDDPAHQEQVRRKHGVADAADIKARLKNLNG